MALNNWWLSSCIFLILGVLFALAAAAIKLYSERGERHFKQTEARVVDIVAEPRTGESAMSEFRNRQAAVFEYFAEGKLIKVPDKTDTYPCPYYLNQKVKISYNPEKPEEFLVLQPNKLKRAAFGMNYMSVMCLLFGCIFFLMHASRVQL